MKNTENTEFLLARKDDLDEIFKIFQNKEEWLKEKEIDQWRGYTQRYGKDFFLNHITNEHMYILKETDKIIACGVLLSGDSLWGELSPDARVLKNLASIESGGGAALMEHMFEMCKAEGIKKIVIDCLATNRDLIGYYKGRGFV
ncbi:MAG: GNAT family N-acetyltransferase [Christensenellaceae bacterium]|jgi:ribosomal protein S18 acetylase RimI-like enzyme|nr:GNAT family N-acetyltransferase [Christensenellaceae bacterium]